MSMFTQRVARFAAASLLAYEERGIAGGTRYIARTVQRKLGLAMRHQQARLHLAAARAALDAQRAASPEDAQIALLLSGGIGDQLVIARFMRDLYQDAGPFRFHVYAARPSICAWVFAEVPGFAGAHYDDLFFLLLGDYDIALRASSFVLTYAERLNWTRICRNRALADRIYALIARQSW